MTAFDPKRHSEPQFRLCFCRCVNQADLTADREPVATQVLICSQFVGKDGIVAMFNRTNKGCAGS